VSHKNFVQKKFGFHLVEPPYIGRYVRWCDWGQVAIIGVQMASAYIGTFIMPPAFGLIATPLSVSLLTMYLLAILFLMVAMYELLIRKTIKSN